MKGNGTMLEYDWGLWRAAGWTAQFAAAAAGIYVTLRAAFVRPPRWRAAKFHWRRRQAPRWWLALCRADRDGAALQERRVLLAGCGLRWPAAVYLAAKRTATAGALAVAGIAGTAIGRGWVDGASGWPWVAAGLLAVVPMVADRLLLNAFRRYRAERIRGEIVAVSRGLLYFTGSRLHLHGKLLRCLSYARLIRGDLQLLLNEWYQDPDASLRRFQERLGTEEASGFAEALRTLRLHEDEEVYNMLRGLVDEYKNRIHLARESRRETASYGLFVLAGIPVLYMFHVFLYPWVREAQMMFDTLQT